MPAPRLTLFVLAAISAVALIAAACGSDDDDNRTILTPVSGDFIPTVISSDIAVGENRFVIGLLDVDQQLIADADLRAGFLKIAEDGSTTLLFDSDLSAITIQRSFTDIHQDGESHRHDGGEFGVYVANVEFDSAGRWQVVVSGTIGEERMNPTPFLFEVREVPLSPAIGAPAPQSVQLIIDDVESIDDIDTSLIPNVEMHDLTIADAVTSGTPTLIVFSTPAFCTSQICGPAKEIVDELYTKFSDSVNFVHVEPYDVVRARSGDCQPGLSACLVPFLDTEWSLRSEPWIFTVDAEGNIAGKFEGVVSITELEEHLQELVAG